MQADTINVLGLIPGDRIGVNLVGIPEPVPATVLGLPVVDRERRTVTATLERVDRPDVRLTKTWRWHEVVEVTNPTREPEVDDFIDDILGEPVEPCGCENSACRSGHVTPIEGAHFTEWPMRRCRNDGSVRVAYVGSICAECAPYMPAEYLLDS